MENYKLVAKIAHDLYKPTRLYDFEDLLQIGLQSAIRLERHFNPALAKKSTFLTICIRRDILKFIKRHTRLFSSEGAPPQVVKSHSPLWASLPKLDPVEAAMVEMLEQGRSKREIAKRFHLTKKELQTKLELIGMRIINE